jgi:peptidyl-prolyl cis-trans isomerase SurA
MKFDVTRPLSLITLLVGLVLSATIVIPASAQNTIGLAAVVNDEPISVIDLIDRMKLVAASSNIQLTEKRRQELTPQLLHQLIDEKLQMQAAKKQGIEVSDDDMKKALASVEQNSGLPPGGLKMYLAQHNVPMEAIKAQMRPQIAWQKLLGTMRSQIQISESEIDDVLNRIKKNQGKPRNKVQEIFLPVDNPDDQSKTLENANRIVNALKSGASFEGIARQFSASASAANGGNLGWLSVGELDSTLQDAINTMPPGDISDPIRTIRGYYILKLLDRQKGDADADRDVKLDLYQLYLPFDENTPQDELKAKINVLKNAQQNAQSCQDMANVATELGSDMSGETKGISPNELSPAVRNAVGNLGKGEKSDVVRVQGGALVVMVCNKTVTSNLPDREEIRKRLMMDRLEILARRKLRDLRRDAFIDIRI